jgi:uncharacterized membrane protein YcaP (DUF421 family)
MSTAIANLEALLVRRSTAHRNRLSEHDVLEDLRLNGNVAEIHDVLLAVLDRNGHISVVRRAQQ